MESTTAACLAAGLSPASCPPSVARALGPVPCGHVDRPDPLGSLCPAAPSRAADSTSYALPDSERNTCPIAPSPAAHMCGCRSSPRNS